MMIHRGRPLSSGVHGLSFRYRVPCSSLHCKQFDAWSESVLPAAVLPLLPASPPSNISIASPQSMLNCFSLNPGRCEAVVRVERTRKRPVTWTPPCEPFNLGPHPETECAAHLRSRHRVASLDITGSIIECLLKLLGRQARQHAAQLVHLVLLGLLARKRRRTKGLANGTRKGEGSQLGLDSIGFAREARACADRVELLFAHLLLYNQCGRASRKLPRLQGPLFELRLDVIRLTFLVVVNVEARTSVSGVGILVGKKIQKKIVACLDAPPRITRQLFSGPLALGILRDIAFLPKHIERDGHSRDGAAEDENGENSDEHSCLKDCKGVVMPRTAMRV
eukprot:scaffold6436_cov113-Isochrysis_galbana.AAC.11